MGEPIRTAAAADVPVLATVLAAAFLDDPIMTWAFPNDSTRPARLRHLFGYVAEHLYVPSGASTLTDGDEAAAMWQPPGRGDSDFWAEHGAPFVAGLEGEADRISLLAATIGEVHPLGPHWYLLAIGSVPAAQGRGLGSALLAHTLASVDDAGDAAYLEATTPRSRALYQRFGFEAAGEIRAGDAPPMWAMWRPPR